MNDKRAKQLRRMARRMAFHRSQEGVDTERRLMVLKSHEPMAKQGHWGHVTAVNNPNSIRGIYRWLKRHHADSGGNDARW